MSTSSAPTAFDVLTTTATELQSRLQRGEITSVQIVETYLAQIDKHNNHGMHLRAVLALAPKHKLLEQARELDDLRAKGELLGPLHGIPVLVKDCYATSPEMGMSTTAGSFALAGSVPKGSATVIDRLIRRGLLILGKANLTEFSNCKSANMTSGWSPVGSQTQSAYIEGGVKPGEERMGYSAPGGSSSGSAVGVAAGFAAGFAPLSIGTENDGSVTSPASRAALYAIKPTTKSIPMEGVFAVTETFDTVGAMAKSPEDLAHLLAAMQSPTDGTLVDFSGALDSEWSKIRIGFLDPRIWKLPPWLVSPNEEVVKQTIDDYEKMVAKMQSNGAKVIYPVDFITRDELKLDGTDILGMLLIHEAKGKFTQYLGNLEKSAVRTVEDVVQFNKDHADVELPPQFPDQSQLEKIVNDKTTEETAQKGRDILRKRAKEADFDQTFERLGIDLLAAPTDSMLASMAAAAGYPIITVPMGVQHQNGRPFGFGAVARAGEESRLFQLMSAYEASFPARIPPPLLQHSRSAREQGQL